MRSSCGGDMQKVVVAHKERRTRARASAKVGVCLGYQAAWRTGTGRAPSAIWSWARSVTRDEGEQGEQGGRDAADRQVRPLALCLAAEVGADLVERDFRLPAQHEPRDDLLRGRSEVGAEQGLGGEHAAGVADEDPANGHGGLAAVVPERRSRDDLDHARVLPIPARHGDRRPLRRGIDGARPGRAGGARRGGPPLGVGLARRGWIEQACVQAQPRDEGGDLARGGEQLRATPSNSMTA